MPQSLSNVLIHIVFSTKYRRDWITADIETELHRYLSGICRNLDCPCLEIGGTENHVHLLCRLSRTLTIAKLVEKIKTGSSKWIKTRGPEFSGFSWQNGYGAFSIGASNLPALKRYIARQKIHHHQSTFQDELRNMLGKYGVAYDDRYVWD